jgi:hypothetical protein
MAWDRGGQRARKLGREFQRCARAVKNADNSYFI